LRPDKALLDYWYKRLADEGFKDIEPQESYIVYPQRIESRAFRSRLYRAASIYAGHATFADEREKQAWWMFANGKTHRQIRATLRCKDLFVVTTLRKHKEQMQQMLPFQDATEAEDDFSSEEF
jgi:hypothetical protein